MDQFNEKLKLLIDNYIKNIYQVTIIFPKEEMFGITSQLRRAALSVMLNYVEGFARRRGQKCKIYHNFLTISFGSLKESKYLLYLSQHLGYLSDSDYNKIIAVADEVGAMLYKTIQINE